MSQGKFILLLLLAGSLGIWGCAQGAGNGANGERIRALESKTARLEEDFKASVAARDQLRKKVASLDEERIQLSQQVEQLQLVVKERDSLKQQLAVRTSERDTGATPTGCQLRLRTSVGRSRTAETMINLQSREKGCPGGVEPTASTFTESHAKPLHHEHHVCPTGSRTRISGMPFRRLPIGRQAHSHVRGPSGI